MREKSIEASEKRGQGEGGDQIEDGQIQIQRIQRNSNSSRPLGPFRLFVLLEDIRNSQISMVKVRRHTYDSRK